MHTCGLFTIGEKMELIWTIPGPLGPKSHALSRRYKSRLVPQDSTRVLHTYTRWHYFIHHVNLTQFVEMKLNNQNLINHIWSLG